MRWFIGFIGSIILKYYSHVMKFADLVYSGVIDIDVDIPFLFCDDHYSCFI